MAEIGRRRQGLYQLAAALVAGPALAALLAPAPVRETMPPRLPAGPAIYRPDGGQAIMAGGPLAANALTNLNLGRRLPLAQTDPWLLAKLPGLGERSAVKAHQTGCLAPRQRKKLHGLVSEICAPNNP